MDIKRLQELVAQESIFEKVVRAQHWNKIWIDYMVEKNEDYSTLSIKEALPRFISEQNLRERRNETSSLCHGVYIEVGDICYIDFGEAYINEIGYQHFAIIIAMFHNKAFVVPMSGNEASYEKAFDKGNPYGRKHLMRLGEIKGLNKKSVLFLNDAKFINTARVIDVKAHICKDSPLFKEIVERFNYCVSSS